MLRCETFGLWSGLSDCPQKTDDRPRVENEMLLPSFLWSICNNNKKKTVSAVQWQPGISKIFLQLMRFWKNKIRWQLLNRQIMNIRTSRAKADAEPLKRVCTGTNTVLWNQLIGWKHCWALIHRHKEKPRSSWLESLGRRGNYKSLQRQARWPSLASHGSEDISRLGWNLINDTIPHVTPDT